MSRIPPDIDNKVPGLQYPDINEGTQEGAALRNVFDNLFYLRRLAEARPRVQPVTVTQVKSIVQKLISTQQSEESESSGAFIVNTHAIRLTNHPPSNYDVGQGYVETDRDSLYVVSDESGIKAWVFVAGVMENTLANRPTDLGADDTGFTFVNTNADQNTQYIWSGTEWWTIGGYLQDILDAATNTATIVQSLVHRSTAVPLASFGLRRLERLHNDANAEVDAVAFNSEWTNPAAGAEDSIWRGFLRTTGAVLAEAWRFVAGNLTLPGSLFWRSGGANTGTLSHAATASRVYTLPDESVNVASATTTLTANQLVLGNAIAANAQKLQTLGSLGTTTTVLHGNAAGAPSFAAVDLAADVTGELPVANGGTAANTAAGARTSLDVAQRQTVGGSGPGTYTTITSITVTAEGTISAISGS